MFEKYNAWNIAKLLFIPICYICLLDYPFVQALLIGLSTMDLYREIEKYGIKALFLKPDPEIVRRIFSLVDSGNLEEL